MKLRELRIEYGKTQAEIALFLGTSRQVYANYENEINEPSLDTLARLADFFECSIDFLIGREDHSGNIVIRNDKTAATLTADEQSLLDTFRKLNTKNRMHVAAYAEVRLEEQEKGNLRA